MEFFIVEALVGPEAYVGIGLAVAGVTFWRLEKQSRGEWSRDESIEHDEPRGSAYRGTQGQGEYRGTAPNPRVPRVVQLVAFGSFVSVALLIAVSSWIALAVPLLLMGPVPPGWIVFVLALVALNAPILKLGSWGAGLLRARPSISADPGPWRGLLLTVPALPLGVVLCMGSDFRLALWGVALVVASCVPVATLLGQRSALGAVMALWTDRGYQPEELLSLDPPARRPAGA